MLTTFLSSLAAALSLQASVPVAGASETVNHAVGTVNSVCLALATREMVAPDWSDTSQRRAFLAAFGFSEIIPEEALENLGESRAGVTDADVLGYRRVGRDDLFIAIGGSRIPSCRVAIGTRSQTLADGTAINATIAQTGVWASSAAASDHGPMRIWRFGHQAETGISASLSVISGQRNMNRNLILMIVDPTRSQAVAEKD